MTEIFRIFFFRFNEHSELDSLFIYLLIWVSEPWTKFPFRSSKISSIRIDYLSKREKEIRNHISIRRRGVATWRHSYVKRGKKPSTNGCLWEKTWANASDTIYCIVNISYLLPRNQKLLLWLGIGIPFTLGLFGLFTLSSCFVFPFLFHHLIEFMWQFFSLEFLSAGGIEPSRRWNGKREGI